MAPTNINCEFGAYVRKPTWCFAKMRIHDYTGCSARKGILPIRILICLGMLLVEASSFGQGPDSTIRQNPQITPSAAANTRRHGQHISAASPGGTDSPMETAVVTLDGTCEGPRKNAATKACRTVITRGEIESMISALVGNASPASRTEFAVDYAKLAVAYGAAQRRHLEENPQVARELQMYETLIRMQVLANALDRQIKAKASSIAVEDVAKYYEENKKDFAQGTIKRIYIPKSLSVQSGSPDTAILRAKAEELRARAAAGEDFGTIQQDAYKDLGVKTPVPATRISNVRRSRLLGDDTSVFDLAPGSVTPVLDSPTAFSILGLEEKGFIPLEDVRLEITAALQRKRTEQELREAVQSANAHINLSYLNLPAVPEMLPPPELIGLTGQRGTRGELGQRSALRPQTWRSKRSVTVFPQTKP